MKKGPAGSPVKNASFARGAGILQCCILFLRGEKAIIFLIVHFVMCTNVIAIDSLDLQDQMFILSRKK